MPYYLLLFKVPQNKIYCLSHLLFHITEVISGQLTRFSKSGSNSVILSLANAAQSTEILTRIFQWNQCYSFLILHNLSSLLVCTNMDGLSSFCVACRMSTTPDWIDNCMKLPSSSSTTTTHPTRRRSVSQRNSTCNGVAGGRTHISPQNFGVHHMLLLQ